MKEKFLFESVRSLNGYKLPDILKIYSPKEISSTLREMAYSAQNNIKLDPSNKEYIKYAESLTWHYVSLRDANHLLPLIGEIKIHYRRFSDLSKIFATFDKRFDSFVKDIDALQRYTKSRYPHYIGLISTEELTSLILAAKLNPSRLASLVKNNNVNYSTWLDGALKLLKVAPWSPRHTLMASFEADPEQRIEFEEACNALVPEAKDLQRILNKACGIDAVERNLQKVCNDFQMEWDRMIDREMIPFNIWEDAMEILNKKYARKNVL